MTFKLHNTLTGKLEEFVSLEPNQVSLYTCGPTVYDYLHVGNWAAYIYWDTLVRVLMANDYTVNRVMNITDVGHLVSDADEGEDKLEKGAKREGKTAWEVADFYTKDFLNNSDRLGLVTPQHIAKATDFISQQLDLVRTLKEKGYTYQIDDGVYFDTSKFPTYADFAHLNLESLQAGARVKFNPQKRHPSDFALWKFTPEGEERDMEWQTPGDLLEEQRVAASGAVPIMGFPGWHLECSAMAMSLLGETLDIHTGGIDHIPVHHTNEIAESEAATGKRFSNYWLHNNHLKADGTKISKSLGNGYTLDDLEKKGFTPHDYRLFVLQSHYRTEGNFTFDNLTAAKNRLHNWRNNAALRHQIHDTLTDDRDREADNKAVSLYATSQALLEALGNDLNTPEALMLIDDAFSRLLGAKLENIHRHALVELLETIDNTLGLQLIDSSDDISDDSKRLIVQRTNARNNKDWSQSDALRDELLGQGIVIRDTLSGSVWEYVA
ncbi:cysteine--tRNA ligase [Candidatus Saccharibacteria bacterium]|nr:cysteine--tRNA ligase [Candidatus Saccharibacteria bacterium]